MLAAIVAFVVVTGTPAVQREAKLDASRVRDPSLVEAAFEPTGAHAYRLCAKFTTDTAVIPPASGYWSENEKWAHGTGRLCFNRSADAKD